MRRGAAMVGVKHFERLLTRPCRDHAWRRRWV